MPTRHATPAHAFDAAPFGLPLPGEPGIAWEDPREIHRVVVRFAGPPPPAAALRLEYWGSRWPQQRIPRDAEPGGGNVGWWELGNWYNGGWRAADARCVIDGGAATFTFHPVDAREFPEEHGFDATWRFTLKLRISADAPMPPVERFEAITDSGTVERTVRFAWREAPPAGVRFEAFNGAVLGVRADGHRAHRVRLRITRNPNVNTFDRTLLTVHTPSGAFTVAVDELADGPLLLPDRGVAVLRGTDRRGFSAVVAAAAARHGQSLVDRIAQMPEQTWSGAWKAMPARRQRIYLPLGLEGGRQRFRLDGDGAVQYRGSDGFIAACPGAETERLTSAPAPVRLEFGLPGDPRARTIQDGRLPISIAEWEDDGIVTEQVAFATPLGGADAAAPPPAGDEPTVCMVRFVCTNTTAEPALAALSVRILLSNAVEPAFVDAGGALYAGEHWIGHASADAPSFADAHGRLRWARELAPGEPMTVVLRLPFVPPADAGEQARIAELDFTRERAAVAGYWLHRTAPGMRLTTPEPALTDFHRAHAPHLLINCEREPGSDLLFARVGSFGYGAFSNESCMMVVELDRRGHHAEARRCLEAWLRYQGTAPLPGDFSSCEGVLYGAAGYEHGGYNQHHGWILWCMAEHFRFTRDAAWLAHAAPGIAAGAEWIVRERARTVDRDDIARGLLPAGSLEDIGDWWPWLSTNCYTWRGLADAAWALEQIGHPDAPRYRRDAAEYHAALLTAFRAAAERSPVVRLRDGTAVAKIPSQVYRRGRFFGWICETLEGAIHLLITGAIDPRSPEAGAILRDVEDNLYISNQYGYTVDDFERQWFDLGGFSMQACLLLGMEPYLYRDEPKHAIRAMFNSIAANLFPDVRMLTEHALPHLGDWRGDHYKSSDEANACGWLRYCFLREQGDDLLVGQAVPSAWLADGQRCGVEDAGTWFGPTSAMFEGGPGSVTLTLRGPRRNAPSRILVRFRHTGAAAGIPPAVTVDGQPWTAFEGDYAVLPGDIGDAVLVAAR